MHDKQVLKFRQTNNKNNLQLFNINISVPYELYCEHYREFSRAERG